MALLKAEQIQKIRNKMGLTQDQLADKLMLAPESGGRTVRRWENGTTPITGPANVALSYIFKEFRENQ